jgi:hypothetical protein
LISITNHLIGNVTVGVWIIVFAIIFIKNCTSLVGTEYYGLIDDVTVIGVVLNADVTLLDVLLEFAILIIGA